MLRVDILLVQSLQDHAKLFIENETRRVPLDQLVRAVVAVENTLLEPLVDLLEVEAVRVPTVDAAHRGRDRHVSPVLLVELDAVQPEHRSDRAVVLQRVVLVELVLEVDAREFLDVLREEGHSDREEPVFSDREDDALLRVQVDLVDADVRELAADALHEPTDLDLPLSFGVAQWLSASLDRAETAPRERHARETPVVEGLRVVAGRALDGEPNLSTHDRVPQRHDDAPHVPLDLFPDDGVARDEYLQLLEELLRVDSHGVLE